VVGLNGCRKGWIAVVLDAGLPATHGQELSRRKTEALLQHVYEKYWGAELRLYAGMST